METHIILLVASISLFAITSIVNAFDCPDSPFISGYPLSYRLHLNHSWCRKVAKISLILATITWFIFPIFGGLTIGDFGYTGVFAAYFMFYVLLAAGWFVVQIIIYVICLFILVILNFIWELLKELYEWLKE